MDRASSLIYPGSRTLAGWWRQLAAYQPQAFWIGYAFLHRIEAPVNVLCSEPVDPLCHLVLQAISLEQSTSVASAQLQARLHLPGAVVQHVLADMHKAGLLARSTDDRWQPTEHGRDALQTRHYPRKVSRRQTFPFLERTDAVGNRLDTPHFVPIAECVGAPWPVDDAHRFDRAGLQACVAQPADWKQALAFPHEVQAFGAGPASEAWQEVILDRPERVLLALIVAANELLGFAVKVDGWTLFERAPVLRLPASACAMWPGLAKDPPASAWHDAWRHWCRERQLPTNEVEICAVKHQPPRLEVQTPSRLMQRLQAAKSDLFKGDVWLMIGDGYVRTAAQLTVRQHS